MMEIAEPVRVLPENFKQTTIDGVYRIENPIRGDARGDFQEVFHIPDVSVAALPFDLPNSMLLMSRSSKGVVRGIHAEPIAKIVTCGYGEIFVAIVDVRPDSPTFKKIYQTRIKSNERVALFLPPGVGNSFQALSEEALYVYFVDHLYPGSERASAIPALKQGQFGIDWPIKNSQVSERDNSKAVTLEEFLKVRSSGYQKYLYG